MNELYNESTCQASRMCGFLLKILLLILSLYLNYIPTFSELMIIPSIHYLKFENQHFKYPGILQMCNSFSHSWKAPKTPKDWYNYTIITIIHTEVHMVSHVWSLHLATWTKQVKIRCLMQCVCAAVTLVTGSIWSLPPPNSLGGRTLGQPGGCCWPGPDLDKILRPVLASNRDPAELWCKHQTSCQMEIILR